MNINFKQIAYNRTALDRKVEYIVIHDTGNQSAGSTAEMHYRYFNGADRQASADFFVDNNQILQVNDYNKYYTWHCGDGKGAYGITNRNSVGIEMCINTDGNYMNMLDNTVDLVWSLMAKLNLPASRIVRHYDASRKICPGSMSAANWTKWENFKMRFTHGGNMNIINAQLKLNALGYALNLDGQNSAEFQKAVRDFQYIFSIPDDGIVNEQTLDKLNDIVMRRQNGYVPFK